MRSSLHIRPTLPGAVIATFSSCHRCIFSQYQLYLDLLWQGLAQSPFPTCLLSGGVRADALNAVYSPAFPRYRLSEIQPFSTSNRHLSSSSAICPTGSASFIAVIIILSPSSAQVSSACGQVCVFKTNEYLSLSASPTGFRGQG